MGAEAGKPTERLLIEGLTLAPNAPPIDGKVRAGEIVGLAGLDGHGQEAFLEDALRPAFSPLGPPHGRS